MQRLAQTNEHPLSQPEIQQAGVSGVALQDLIEREHPCVRTGTLRVKSERSDGEEAEFTLPGPALPLLSVILRELGNGKDVVVLATDAEVTTQQAATFLRVSRPYLVKLLEEGKIPYRLVGPRRRLLVKDLLRYKEQEEADRHRGLDELTAEAQRLGMY